MRKWYTGIDIGSQQVKIVVCAPSERPELPMQVLGTGLSPSRGVKEGYIFDTAEVARSIREALQRALVSSKIKIRSARVALGGVGIEEMRGTADVTLTQSGGIVHEKDIERAMRESEKRASPKLANRTIIHTIPLEYRIDGQKVLGRPQGMQGAKLSIDTLLVTTLTQHYDDIVEAVEAAGVEVEGVMASPLAASLVALTKHQKAAGVMLADIGAETVSTVIFDGDIPVSLKVFPGGGSDVTKALALAFQLPLTEAEQMKRGAVTGSDVPHAKARVVVAGRLRALCTELNAHLKTLGRSRLLPAGVVFTGGGSGIPGIVEAARATLKLPAQVGQIGQLSRGTGVDASWAVAYGLCRWGYAEDTESAYTLSEVIDGFWDSVRQALRNLLP